MAVYFEKGTHLSMSLCFPISRPKALAILIALSIAAAQCVAGTSARAEATFWEGANLVSSPDDTANLLWIHQLYSAKGVYWGAAGELWALNSANAKSSNTEVFTKGPGWAIGGGGYEPDGTIRIIWVKVGNSKDTIQISALSADGVETSSGPG